MKTAISTLWLPTGGLAMRTFLRLLALSVFCFLAAPASAQQWRYWVSTNNANWSNPNNWSPVGVPQNGESLAFIDNGLLVETSNNDLPNLTVGYLSFNHDHTLVGNAIGISNGISCGSGDATVTLHLQCPVILTSDATFNSVWAGGLVFNENHFYLEGPVNLNGHDLELRAKVYPGENFLNQRGNIYISGPITGTGNVEAVVEELATIAFSGASPNTFSGALTVRTATGTSVYFNKQSVPVVNDQLVLKNAAVVRYGNHHQIGDNATVSLIGGARLLLQGYSDTIGNLVMTNVHADATPSRVDTFSGDFAGTLTVNDGIVSSVDNASIVPTIRGILNLPGGNHNFFVSAANYDGLNLEAQVTGAGGFTKFGNAALLLKGTNTFGGAVYASGGIIDVSNPNGFGSPAGGVVLNGGSVTLRNLTIASETLTAQGQQPINSDTTGSLLFSVGASGWAGTIVLETNLVLGGADMVLTGEIVGAGGLDFRTFGTAQLGGLYANTFTGKTLARGPLLQLNKPLGVNAYAGPLEVGGGAGGPYVVHWLNFYQNPNTPLTLFANGVVDLNGQVEDFGPVTFNGGTVQTGVGFFIGNSNITATAAATAAAIHGNLSFGITPAYFVVSNGVAEPDLWVNAIIYGADLRKQGPGTLLFTAPNQHTGYTLVEDGILHADNPLAFGTLSGNTIVWETGTIRLGGVDGMTEAFQLNGPGFQGTNGALQVAGSGAMYGGVWLSSPATINTLPGASLAINSVIDGGGPLTKTGSGTLTFSGPTTNLYSGGTIVSAGTLQLFKNQNNIAAPGSLTIGPATPSSPATARCFNVGMMPAGGTVTVNANGLLDLNGNNQLLSQLNLNDGGDAQTGAATGTLSFTGFGSVNVGTLQPGLPGLQASASISGRIAAMTDDYLLFNIAPYGLNPLAPEPELVVSAQIVGTRSSIAKNGQGTMWLSGNNTFDGTIAIVTEFNLNAGAVIAASSTALGGANNWVYVINGASLALVNNISINNKRLYLNSTNPAALDNRGGSNVWTGPIAFSQDSGISVNQDWSLTVPGAVTGTGALIKRGAGLLRLSGAANNTFAGNTVVDEGFLYLAKSPGLQAVPANLIIGRGAGGTSATVRHYGQDPVWGDITVNHGGVLDLNGFDEYSGILTLNGGGDVQTGAGTLYPFTSVSVNPGGFADQSVISGRLGLFPGTIPFTVGAGTLAPGSAECLISATIVQYSTTARLQKNGAGILRLTANNTYTGRTTVDGGTLWIDGAQPQSPIDLDHETRLQGSGTVGDVNLIGSFTAIAPGNSPGMLTCSNIDAFNGSGTLEMELNAHPTGYDQVSARGTVILTGFNLKASLNFASSVGQQFTLINNDGTDAVSGTFTGLPQNKKLYVGGELFQISYTGGTGNDVVLTRLVTPPPPTLTIERVAPASVRLLWPTNDPTFSLQSNTNLNSTNWIAAPPLPSISNTNHVVTNTISGSAKFYRLSNP